MEHKPIYLDGIDVSECQFYCNGACEEITDEDGGYIDKCTEYFDCYFKQLKRKDQELKTICEAFEIEYAKDEETGHIFGRSNKLLRKEQALNAILELVEENKNTCQYQGICKSILGIIKQVRENNR